MGHNKFVDLIMLLSRFMMIPCKDDANKYACKSLHVSYGLRVVMRYWCYTLGFSRVDLKFAELLQLHIYFTAMPYV